MLGYVIKTHLHTHKRAQEDNVRRESPNNILPIYSQVDHRRHQPITGPSSQAQRSTGVQWQAGTQIKDSEEGHSVQAPNRSVPGDPQPHCPGVKPIQMSHQEQRCGSPFRIRMRSQLSSGTHGMQGKNILESHRTYYWMFTGGTKGGKR